jgi:hypothetical protein
MPQWDFGSSCYEDQDNFIRHLAPLRAEERVASAVPVPAGLVTGTFSGSTAATTGHAPAKE